jgi:SAM-dependent methyltransferase
MVKATKLAIKPKLISGKDLKLDLGCGDNKRPDFLGVDKFKTASTDYTFDLFEFPWPIEDGVVAELSCSHFFEHVPAKLRPLFMDEAWRILKPGGQFTVVVPHYNSMRAIQDYTHEWPPIGESSFLYFNLGWRTANKLLHGAYEMKCDFDFGYGYSLDPDVQVRNQEYQQVAIKHYSNAAMDLHVTLTARK